MCPACANKRLHGPAEWAHHPDARHGYQRGQGWSRADLNPATRNESATGGGAQISGEVREQAPPEPREGN
jgi:hypothetical protein